MVYINAHSPGSCILGTPHTAVAAPTRCLCCSGAPLLLTAALQPLHNLFLGWCSAHSTASLQCSHCRA